MTKINLSLIFQIISNASIIVGILLGLLNLRNFQAMRKRESTILMLLSFVKNQKIPVIVLGDLNVTEQNDAYKIAEANLTDTWREKGWGFGHTFPGAASTGSSRPAILGIPLAPKWLVRLDYVFCSNEWQVESASFGQWDGVSDHRPVRAILSLIN